jgi:hypothetical protein
MADVWRAFALLLATGFCACASEPNVPGSKVRIPDVRYRDVVTGNRRTPDLTRQTSRALRVRIEQHATAGSGSLTLHAIEVVSAPDVSTPVVQRTTTFFVPDQGNPFAQAFGRLMNVVNVFNPYGWLLAPMGGWPTPVHQLYDEFTDQVTEYKTPLAQGPEEYVAMPDGTFVRSYASGDLLVASAGLPLDFSIVVTTELDGRARVSIAELLAQVEVIMPAAPMGDRLSFEVQHPYTFESLASFELSGTGATSKP